MDAYSVASNALFGANPPIDLPLSYRDSWLVVDRGPSEPIFGSSGMPTPVLTSPIASSVDARHWARTDTEMSTIASFNITRSMCTHVNTSRPTPTAAVGLSHSSYWSEEDGHDREEPAELWDQEPYPPSPGPPPTKPLPPLPKRNNWT